MARNISNKKISKKNRTHGSIAKTRRVDPILTEIVRNGVIAVTEEMKTNLMRTAYNMIIYEALDFTTGLFTAEGRHGLDRHRPAELHPRHVEHREGEDRAFRAQRASSRATSTSPTTPTPPAAISIISPSRYRSSTRRARRALLAAWRTGSTSAARSAA